MLMGITGEIQKSDTLGLKALGLNAKFRFFLGSMWFLLIMIILASFGNRFKIATSNFNLKKEYHKLIKFFLISFAG